MRWCCIIFSSAIFGQLKNPILRLKPVNLDLGGGIKQTVAYTVAPAEYRDLVKQRQSVSRHREKCSVLERATSSPTSDALIFISLLAVARLISSHLFRCSLWSGSLVSAGQAELLEEVLTRRRGGCSVLTVHSGDM